MAHGKNWRTFPRDIPGWLLRAFDPYAHAITVMDHEHRMIHDGMAFHATHRSASLANGASMTLLVYPGANCYAHIQHMQLSVGAGDCDVTTHEGVTTSADGTALTVLNRDRNSTNTSGLVLKHTPTITDWGTTIHDRLIVPTGTGVGNTEGIVTPNLGEEWILKPNTKYAMRLTNNSGGAIKVALEMYWYEPSYVVDEPN